MKKLIAIFAAMMLAVLPLAARDEVYHSADVLPQNAQQTLRKAFPKSQVTRVKVDKSILGSKEYEVILNNGTEIEFDNEGDWKEVDCGRQAVPAMFVLKSIQNHVRNNYKGQAIIKVDKDKNRYEVELVNGTDLEFDRAGNFLRVDD